MAHTRSPEQIPARPEPLIVRILGPLHVQRGSVVLDATQLGGPKPRQILEILLLRVGTSVSKERLVELIWEGNAPTEAMSTLESYVSVLRRHLQPGCGKSGPLKTTNGGYFLDPTLVDLDLNRFDSRLRLAADADPAVAFPLLMEALAIADAPLLGDELRPAWAEEERGRHAARVATARTMAAEAAIELGRPTEAARLAELAVEADPLCENAWTALLLARQEEGRPAEGLREYERCRGILERELGCAPGPRLQGAHARLLRATAGQDDGLSEVLAALLVLHEALVSSAQGATPSPTTRVLATTSAPAGSDTGMSNVRAIDSRQSQASAVLSSFLQRALAAA
ncbi:AfsR/SARP family transcriptional regulator [Planctomonas deserti]|uniref:AfsR/SARP family transcriptional regulator n=1 Tax=Planctomonas deserti TaxID=2144185 RepID=UPI000D3441E5|nr:BTAD domain-containing putative transcriptional regulator [Planctomonas deserti]